MIVVKKKCLIAYAKLNESDLWSQLSARHAKEGRPPATNYTPPPPPPPYKSLGTQRELMAKVSGKSQTIIKWCKNM